jgi:hypothetical protein
MVELPRTDGFKNGTSVTKFIIARGVSTTVAVKI